MIRTVNNLIMAALLSAAVVTPALAQPITIHVHDDQGGVLGEYLDKYETIKAAGEKVELSGDCLSACTLVLRLPKWEVCAMPGTRLGFHASRDTVASTKPNVEATIWFFNLYPQPVRDWILSLPITLKLRYRTAKSLGIRPCHQDRTIVAAAVQGNEAQH